MLRSSGYFLPLSLALVLTACGTPSDYPSLARRPAERATGSAIPVAPATPPVAPAPPSPQLITRLAQLVEQARTAHQRFAGARDRVERLVAAASGSAPGSEAWSAATVALSELQSARSDATVALAELDTLYTAQAIDAVENGNPTSVAAIAAAREEVVPLLEQEEDVLNRLQSRLAA